MESSHTTLITYARPVPEVGSLVVEVVLSDPNSLHITLYNGTSDGGPSKKGTLYVRPL